MVRLVLDSKKTIGHHLVETRLARDNRMLLLHAEPPPHNLRELLLSQMVTADALAESLGVSRQTIWRWTAKRGMPSTKLGNTRLYNVEAVRDWVHAQPSTP